VGGMARVMDVRAAHGASGLEGVVWCATKVVDDARGMTEVREAGDKGAM
jgi:hypothetical protein